MNPKLIFEVDDSSVYVTSEIPDGIDLSIFAAMIANLHDGQYIPLVNRHLSNSGYSHLVDMVEAMCPEGPVIDPEQAIKHLTRSYAD